MSQTSMRDILPLAVGLGATAMLSFALGGLTTYWALDGAPARVAFIDPAPSMPAASLMIPAAVAAPVELEPMPPLPPPVEPAPLQVEAAPEPVRVAEVPPAPPPARPEVKPEPKPEPKIEAKVVRAPSQPAPSNGFAVQVGAYLEINNARRMALQLAAQGVKARVVTWTDHSGRMWYATRVGSHDAAGSAELEAAELSRHGFKTLVVRKVSGESS